VAVIIAFMLATLALAATVGGLVLVGIENRWQERVPPRLARELKRAARHLNGDGKPPKHLLQRLQSALTR
jgi:hypothetical protein